jgi:hypothetical protein
VSDTPISLLADLEEFVADHRPHGTLTGDATEPAWNGYLLTVACPCGVVFERWVMPGGCRAGRARDERRWRQPCVEGGERVAARDSLVRGTPSRPRRDQTWNTKRAALSPRPDADRFSRALNLDGVCRERRAGDALSRLCYFVGRYPDLFRFPDLGDVFQGLGQ